MKPWERNWNGTGEPAVQGKPWERDWSAPAPAAPSGFDYRQPPHPGNLERFGQNVRTVNEAVGPAIADFAKQQAQTTATHYRNLANLPGSPLGEDMLGLVRQPTEEEQSAYQEEVISGMVAAATGALGRIPMSKMFDALKYVGRGFRTVPGTEAFIAKQAPHYAGAATTKVTQLLNAPLSGAAVQELLDYTNLGGIQPHELAGDTAAATAGVGTSALVLKNTIDDLLVTNPRWKAAMTKPSSSAASAALSALLGYAATKGLIYGKDQIGELVDYVGALYGGEEPSRAEPPPPMPIAPGAAAGGSTATEMLLQELMRRDMPR